MPKPYFPTLYTYTVNMSKVSLYSIYKKKKNGIFNIINTCYIPMIMSNTAYI